MIRVLLVDDNAIVRRGIASLLADAQGIEVVGEAGNGREAIELARKVHPDVVCLDVRMPVMDGVAAAGPLSEKSKVLMLSYSEDEQLVTGAIRNGAAGYLVHGRFEPDDLEARIKAVAAGEMVLSPAVTPAVFEALRRAPGTENESDELEELVSGRHFGVTGMRERAQLAGGDLSVESAPGEGCVLSVWMQASRKPSCTVVVRSDMWCAPWQIG